MLSLASYSLSLGLGQGTLALVDFTFIIIIRDELKTKNLTPPTEKVSLHSTRNEIQISTSVPMLRPSATPLLLSSPSTVLFCGLALPALPRRRLGRPCHHNIILSVFVAAIPMESLGRSLWDITKEEMRTMYRGCWLPCYRLGQRWGQP